MSSRSTATTRAGKSDVRRTLFRSFSRAPPSSSNTTAPSSSSAAAAAAASAALNDDSESIVVRNKDGSLDVELPLPNAHMCGEEGEERETVEQRAAAAELVKRHQVDLKRLPELLRLKVLSLSQDNWIFEAEEEV